MVTGFVTRLSIGKDSDLNNLLAGIRSVKEKARLVRGPGLFCFGSLLFQMAEEASILFLEEQRQTLVLQ